MQVIDDFRERVGVTASLKTPVSQDLASGDEQAALFHLAVREHALEYIQQRCDPDRLKQSLAQILQTTLKSDPISLDTVWTTMTAAKEAGYARQEAEVGSFWQ